MLAKEKIPFRRGRADVSSSQRVNHIEEGQRKGNDGRVIVGADRTNDQTLLFFHSNKEREREKAIILRDRPHYQRRDFLFLFLYLGTKISPFSHDFWHPFSARFSQEEPERERRTRPNG